MKHYYLYDAPYTEFNEETNELEHKYKRLSKEMTKWQFAKVVIANILVILLVCALLITLSCLGFVEEGHSIIFPLVAFGLLFGGCGAAICWGRLCDYNYYIGDSEEELITKLFSEEIEEIQFLRLQEIAKATIWRLEHPLEEKCRLAMTKNPNYVADLIKYVKGSNDDHNDTCPYCGSKDTVVQTAKHYDQILMTTEERHRIKCCNCGKILSQDYEENNK